MLLLALWMICQNYKKMKTWKNVPFCYFLAIQSANSVVIFSNLQEICFNSKKLTDKNKNFIWIIIQLDIWTAWSTFRWHSNAMNFNGSMSGGECNKLKQSGAIFHHVDQSHACRKKWACVCVRELRTFYLTSHAHGAFNISRTYWILMLVWRAFFFVCMFVTSSSFGLIASLAVRSQHKRSSRAHNSFLSDANLVSANALRR